MRGDVGRGSGSDGRGKGCATPTCSWRLLAIALLLTCGLLAAALAYLTGKQTFRCLLPAAAVQFNSSRWKDRGERTDRAVP